MVIKMSRTPKLTKDTIFEAVRRYRTLTYNVLAEKLGVHRSNIGRYFKDNPKVKEEAEQILKDVTVRFEEESVMDIEKFKEIPIVAEWIDILQRKELSNDTLRGNINGLFNVSNALQLHPSKFDLDYVSKNVVAWKYAKEKGMDYPKGCAYLNIRHGLRSFFTIMLGVPAEQLTIKGIGAEHSKGFAKSSQERIEINERITMLKNTRLAVDLTTNGNTDKELYTLEMIGVQIFMYATATRIQATIDTRLDDRLNVYKDGYYEIHCVDKGKRGGYDWQKKLIDAHYKFFAKYIEVRHGILVEEQPEKLKSVNEYIFPLLQKSYK